MRKTMIATAMIAAIGFVAEHSQALTYTWITKETSAPNLHRALCHYTMDQATVNLYNLYRYKCEQTAPTPWLEERPDPWGTGGPFGTGWFTNTAPFTDVKLLYQELCPQEIVHNFASRMDYCDGFLFSCSTWSSAFGNANQHWKICKN